MPQPKNVKESFSLKEACLDNIAIHMTNFWCKHHCKKAGSIYEDGPFECMPGSLLDEIIETLKRKELLRLSHWSLLITSHLERLYFSDVTNEEPIPYDLIAFRCKVTALGVEAALRHLPNLQYLNHPELVSTIGEMHRADWEAGMPIPPYQLTSLFAGSEREHEHYFQRKKMDKVSLSVAVYACPSVTDVYLRFDRVQVSADKRSCSDVPPWHWKQLLSSPVLETVCSHNSSVLTDGVLKEVLSQGQKFSRLRELRLEFSECFTSEFIRLLLHTMGPLKRILLQDCSCVTESEVTSLRALIEENNWDVIIDQWCSLDRWR